MTDRLVLSAALALLSVAIFIAARSIHLWVVRRRLNAPPQGTAPGLAGFRPGRPALLYFSTPSCVPCRVVVKPTLQRLLKDLENRFQVLEVNAEVQTEAVRYWNVLSVPTIFVLDPRGTPRYVHYGVVSPEVLRDQLSTWLSKAGRRRAASLI